MMIKKVYWIIVAVCVIVILLQLRDSHEVTFNYLPGKPIDLKFDLLFIVTFAAGMLSVLISGFISKSERFVSELTSYSSKKRIKKLDALFEEAKSCVEFANYARGKELLNSYLKEEINNIDAYMLLADLYITAEEYDSAKGVLKRASVVSKEDVKILSRLIEVYIKLGNKEKAVRILKEIRERSEDKSLYNKRIFDIYFSMEDYKNAYEYQKELEKDSNIEGLKEDFLINEFNLALLHQKENKAQESQKHLKSIIKKDKHFYGAYVEFANSLIAEGKKGEAIEFLKKAFDDVKFPYFAKMIENIYMSDDNPDLAIAFYQNEIESNEKDLATPQILAIYALCISFLLKLEMIDYAIEAVNEVIGTDKEQKIFHYFLAECYMRHKNYESASREYSEYLSSRITHPVAFKCDECDTEHDDFDVVCTRCGNYNTINYNII